MAGGLVLGGRGWLSITPKFDVRAMHAYMLKPAHIPYVVLSNFDSELCL